MKVHMSITTNFSLTSVVTHHWKTERRRNIRGIEAIAFLSRYTSRPGIERPLLSCFRIGIVLS